MGTGKLPLGWRGALIFRLFFLIRMDKYRDGVRSTFALQVGEDPLLVEILFTTDPFMGGFLN